MEEDEVETDEDRFGAETGEDEGPEDSFEEDESAGQEEEEAGEAGNAVEEEEPELSEAPVSYYTPPAGDTPEMTALREQLADPSIADMVRAAIAAEVGRATAAATVGQAHLTAIAAERPALWKAYGVQATQLMASQTPEQRAKAENAEGVLLMAALGSHIGKPTYAAALRKYSALYNNEEAPAAPRKREVIPPVQRPPSPSSRGGAAEAPRNSTERKIDMLVREGIPKSQARAMVASGEV